jgi:mannose-6-phosphate isomerase
MSDAYPLLFRPIFKDKVWGGRALEKVGKTLPAGQNIGESWELADLDATSASGGGGGSALSVIDNGPLAGNTLRQAINLWGASLMGAAKLTAGGAFPLLVKFLDARESLSVQVHPSPTYAEAHKDAHLKTESWYILAAEPNAVIYKGVKPGVSKSAFAAHISDNTVANDMIAIPAVAGEIHNLPSGTCHALGAGVLVAEIQTPSDTTFRVFDWGRVGRELHIEQALACIDFGPAPSGASLPPGSNRARLVTTEFYTIEEARPRAGEAAALKVTGGPTVVMVLRGSGEIRSGSNPPVAISTGHTALVPASLTSTATFIAASDATVLIAGI